MTKKELAVYDYLHDYRAETGKVNLSNKQIREVIDINDRTLYRALNSLEKVGWIKRETYSIGNGGKQRIIHIL